jgi:ABC-type glycerol-3-phosphate transport system substrate-binding protein
MKRKFFVSSLVVLLMSGCSGQAGSQMEAKKDAGANVKAPEPVTVKVAVSGSYFTDAEFERYITAPAKKKYPHITVEKVVRDSKDNTIEKMIASGNIPDMIISATPLMAEYKLYGLDYSLDDLVKKQKLDLGKFDPGIVNALKISSETDKLMAIPYTMHFSALYYNKDLFDRFGVAYPKDGMTWEQATELAKTLTRNEGGVQYTGLDPDHISRSGSQLMIPMIDPKSEKSVLNSEPWKKVFQMMGNVYKAQGVTSAQSFSRFYKEKTVAMYATLNYLSTLADVKDMNWDLASYPVFKEAPGKGAQVDAHVILITSTSKHKEEAFQVIASLVSDEVQMDMARNARVPALKDAKYKEVFGQDVPYLKGKNLKSAFQTAPADPYVPTRYVTAARDEAQKAFVSVVKNEKDINTALRDADELLNKKILEMKIK